ASEIPILTELKECYLVWHGFLPHIPRLSRYTMGVKIDTLFLELLETTRTAQYAKREDKLALLNILSHKLDNLKFFFTILWEAHGLDAGKYGQLSQKLVTAGRMLGKWLLLLKTEAPAARTGA
ncbi:hypothetical protein A3J03_03880, partial [Candidatus Uhrbacteria bacterium RIFCSPLOWO2_02_FULL_46_25]